MSSVSFSFPLALKKLKKEQLTCLICLSTYTNPKQLKCQHAFCQYCLEQIVESDQRGKFTLTCPICRKVTPLPGGVANLPADFRINQLLDLMSDDLEDVTFNTSSKKLAIESKSHAYEKNKFHFCPTHKERRLRLYCNTCESIACRQCFKEFGSHFGHDWEDLDAAFMNHEEKIGSSLEMIEKTTTQLDARCGEVSNQQVVIEVDIDKTASQLHDTINARKTMLIDQLKQTTQEKLKNIETQKEQLETIYVQLQSHLHSLAENRNTGFQGDALVTKQESVKQAQKLAATLEHQHLMNVSTEADTVFSSLADITVGQISAGPPDPTQCFTTINTTARVGEKSTVTLQILNSDNQPCMVSMNSISCELISDITGKKVGSSVEEGGKNQYEVSFQPECKGGHQLHIRVSNQHIKGSPFPVIVKASKEEKLGTPILTIKDVKNPKGIAVNENGEIFVTEKDEKYVSVFSPNGTRLQSFGTQQKSDYCHGISMDSDGNVVVVHEYGIRKFTMQGQVEHFGSKDHVSLREPLDVILNSNDDKIYVTSDRGFIHILNSDFKKLSKFGARGNGEGQFNCPRYISYDSAGNVYVTDRYNDRIQVFTAEGDFLRMIGQSGKGNGELKEPCGIAVDSNDMVYVSEYSNNRISIFTSKGEFVTSFGSKGEGPGQFKGNHGLTVDSSGVVYVCDSINDCIQLF